MPLIVPAQCSGEDHLPLLQSKGDLMHTIIDTIYYGCYKFEVELDTGSETGADQLTVWAAAQLPVDTLPLKQFGATRLFNALIEPERGRLHAGLAAEKRACQQSFETEIASLQHPYTAPGEKLPAKVKRKVRRLHAQMKMALQRLEEDFVRREIWPLERQCFDHEVLQAQSHFYGEAFSLRTFYFAEANDPYIHNFCRKFALDETYQQRVLAGETRWYQRDALFARNLFPQIGEDILLSNKWLYDHKAREFFRWVDTHLEEILALPDYQCLKQKDSAFQPSANDIDLLIQPAVAALNRIPGVTTQFSCQGVSGKVRYQGCELLAVSPHEEYAYVSFSELQGPAHTAISTLLSLFPGITATRIPGNVVLRSVLRSTGDNPRFRAELFELAECVLAVVDSNESLHPGENGPCEQEGATQADETGGGLVANGLPLSRLAWLCQPAQIEQTLRLLFSLNHWAKGREQLLYADRQGLYMVKAAVIQQAVTARLINAVAYIDGSAAFARDYSFNLAADMATAVFFETLAMIFEEDECFPEDVDDSASPFLSLFANITGRELTSHADIETLDVEQFKAFLLERLQALVAQAMSTRQPISSTDLAALCIEPIDLLDIHWSRNRPSPRWDELDESEAYQLDPERLSLIAFAYDSPTAHYIFHLPLRVAERFLPEQSVRALRERPEESREYGVFFGRTITETESQEHPVEAILRELGVDIAAVCPHQLIDKREHISQLASRYPFWEDDEDDEDQDDEDWEMPSSSSSTHTPTEERMPDTCPLCASAAALDGVLRVEHWRQNHPGLDLTVSAAAWVLGKSKIELKSRTFAIPPDYRGQCSEPGTNGTRFWKLKTLETAIRQKRTDPDANQEPVIDQHMRGCTSDELPGFPQ